MPHATQSDWTTRRPLLESAETVFTQGAAQRLLDLEHRLYPARAEQSRDRSREEISTNTERLLALNQPLIQPQGNRSLGYCISKRAFDLLGAAALLILLSPVLLTTLAILAITTRGKPFFAQRRIGYLGASFPMIKFRTMRLDADRLQHLVENEKDGPIFKSRRDPRITRLGRILRKTSIDEMPQLFNVLLGQMSLVGPRPPVPKEVIQYELWQMRRLAIRPGLTCLWQVSGRSEIGFEDWVRMDVWYANNQRFRTDLKLLALTPWTVITCRGAY